MALALASSPAPLARPGRKTRAAREAPPAVPRLSVVVVNYCQWNYTANLVQHLLAAPPVRAGAAEVMVVDNHSPPDRLLGHLRRRPGVSLRRWARNHGFARAVNEGCRLSQGPWLLLLNPDMAIPDGFLDQVLKVADELSSAQPRAGIVGFKLHNRDGSIQLSSGSFPTFPGTVAGLAVPRGRRKYQAKEVRTRCRVPWVTGCCLLVRRDCLRDLGGLDEKFFLYYEDVDLCRRARARGWSVWYEPSVSAVHFHPLHSRAVPPALRLITRHSLLTYAARHWPGWQFQLLAGIVRVEAWLKRRIARWRKDRHAAEMFQTLGDISADLARGDVPGARRRLEAVVRDLEQRPDTRDLRSTGPQQS
jgi:N-acetylglucosaminyl-diphospho-decaprenol L-rhamnosyltransferase